VSLNEVVDPENGGLAVGISFLSRLEAEIVSGNLAYVKFSKVLPVYDRNVGYPVTDRSEIFYIILYHKPFQEKSRKA
jgi:hypothetical protein